MNATQTPNVQRPTLNVQLQTTDSSIGCWALGVERLLGFVFYFLPNCIQLAEIQFAQFLAAPLHFIFDSVKSFSELIGSPLQRCLGVDVAFSGKIYHGK